MYLCLLIVPSTFVTCTVRTLWQIMLTIRWSLGHTHSREPASSLERLVKIPRFAPKTTCFFSWNDFFPLTINIQPDLTLQQFSLLFLFTSLSSSFLQHVCDITSLRCSLNTCLGLFCQITQRDITVCPIKPYKRPVISVVARFEICFSCYPFFLNHTITSETVPRRKFSVSAKYYNVHACPLFSLI